MLLQLLILIKHQNVTTKRETIYVIRYQNSQVLQCLNNLLNIIKYNGAIILMCSNAA